METERKLFVSLEDVLDSEEFVEEIKETITLTQEDLESHAKGLNKIPDGYDLAELLVKEEIFKSLRYYMYTQEYYMYFKLLGYYVQLPDQTLCLIIKKFLSTKFDSLHLKLKATYLTDLIKELQILKGRPAMAVYDNNCWVF